ncbi:Dynein light chain 1, cytoplasmic [Tritrichomonas musculus]|uniref:Dynein light chain n=1 Tax=Tritrichomonas musculus TaxID=1915356 RepID=A0ABR2J166_9EUKA
MSKEESKPVEIPESYGNDMGNDLRNDVKILFKNALKTCRTENEIAKYLQNSLTKKNNGLWHCIVGKDFGSAVVYEQKYHFSGQIGQFYVELWKCDKATKS